MCGHFGDRTFYFMGGIELKIIALQGKSNCGKTTTLKMLIKKILINDEFKLDSNYTESKVFSKCNSNTGDFKCVFICDGIKIGITTRGDTKEALEKDFKKYFNDCQIVICAVHTHGKTVDFIKSKGDAIIHSKWYLEPRNIKKQNEVNAIQSDFLIKDLIEVLK